MDSPKRHLEMDVPKNENATGRMVVLWNSIMNIEDADLNLRKDQVLGSDYIYLLYAHKITAISDLSYLTTPIVRPI